MLHSSKQLAVFDNAAASSDELEDDIRAMSASCLEHLPDKPREELFDPVEDRDSSSKARLTESKCTVFCKVEADRDALGVVGFALVVRREDFVLDALARLLVLFVPPDIRIERSFGEEDLTLDFMNSSYLEH